MYVSSFRTDVVAFLDALKLLFLFFDNNGLIKRISNDDKHRKKMVKNNKMVDKSFPPNDKSLEEIKSNYL